MIVFGDEEEHQCQVGDEDRAKQSQSTVTSDLTIIRQPDDVKDPPQKLPGSYTAHNDVNARAKVLETLELNEKEAAKSESGATELTPLHGALGAGRCSAKACPISEGARATSTCPASGSQETCPSASTAAAHTEQSFTNVTCPKDVDGDQEPCRVEEVGELCLEVDDEPCLEAGVDEVCFGEGDDEKCLEFDTPARLPPPPPTSPTATTYVNVQHKISEEPEMTKNTNFDARAENANLEVTENNGKKNIENANVNAVMKVDNVYGQSEVKKENFNIPQAILKKNNDLPLKNEYGKAADKAAADATGLPRNCADTSCTCTSVIVHPDFPHSSTCESVCKKDNDVIDTQRDVTGSKMAASETGSGTGSVNDTATAGGARKRERVEGRRGSGREAFGPWPEHKEERLGRHKNAP